MDVNFEEEDLVNNTEEESEDEGKKYDAYCVTTWDIHSLKV